MASVTPAHGPAVVTCIGNVRVAVAAQVMEIAVHGQREFGALLVAEIAGVAAGVVEEVVVAGLAADGEVILMIKNDRHQRRPDDRVFTQDIRPGQQDAEKQHDDAYRQRPAGHGYGFGGGAAGGAGA